MSRVRLGKLNEGIVDLDTTTDNYHLDGDGDGDDRGEYVVKKDQTTSEVQSPESGKRNFTHLSPSTPSPSATVKRKKKQWECRDDFYCQLGTKKKKQPSAFKTKTAVSDHAGKTLSCKRQKSAINGLHRPVEVKTPTMIRAEEIQSSFGSEFPSFTRRLVRSHVSSCFWMGLPVPFCKSHLPEWDTTFILEDESREHFEVKFIAGRNGLSGGWRNFAIGHKLLEGDVSIFQLVEPNKFKVNIVRSIDLTEVDGALSLLNLDLHAKPNDTETNDAENGKIVSNDKKRKCPKSLPVAIVKNKKTRLEKSVLKPTQSVKQLETDSKEVGSEHFVGPGLSGSTIRFRDVKSFAHFNILVDGLCIDSEIPNHIRVKYYNLCRSRNSFIHARLLRGLNIKLIAGTISETVNIADAIRASKLTTSRDEFEVWEKSLKSFELMGMNVGFLRARLRRLLSLAIKSEVDVDIRRYIEAKTGKFQADDGIRKLEAKVIELKAASVKFGADIESLKAKAECYEQNFQEEVDAPW